jgi:outer membrane protein OmpA-like peptidoglycan-associated protein
VIAQGISEGLTTAMQSLPPAVAAAPPAYRLEARVEGKRVELQGLVSTPSAQRALIAQVRRNIRRVKIVNSLKVAHAKPDKDWLGVARTGLAQLAHLDAGSLKLDGRKVAVSGKPKSERSRTRLLAAMGNLPRGYTSTVLLERTQDATPPAIAAVPEPVPELDEVRPAPVPAKPQARPPRQVKRPAFVARRQMREPPRRHVARGLSSWCRRRFNDVLPRVAVAFASGSWRMEESVGLSDLARVAQQCPEAHIRLTGHSDTRETSPSATGLSYRRATSVRAALVDRGVAGESITVVGRGGMHPAFSNATADGRENNRRVEFAVW